MKRSLLGILAAVLSLIAPEQGAQATPLYMARSGRACDNCHTNPSTWPEPKLRKRKCNLSCSTCHINPTGGGLRTVSGRFYGQATLPMWAASHRPAKDDNRHLIRFLAESSRRNRVFEPAVGAVYDQDASLDDAWQDSTIAVE